MNKNKNNVNKVTIVSIIIVILVLCLTIGWASFNSSMQIDSYAMVRIKSDIRVTGFNSATSTNNGTSSNENYNVKSVNGTVNLPNASSTVKYRVQVTNMELASNVHMGINSITGLHNNLDILSIEDYSLKTKICDDNDITDCGTGAQKTFYITIGYKDSSYFDSNNTIYNFNMNFEFKKVFDINYAGFTNPPSSPKTVMDGEVTTIQFGNDAREDLSVISGGVTLVLNTNYTYSNKVLTFLTPIRDDIYIVNPSTFTITYVLNDGVQAPGQITSYSSLTPESILAATRDGYRFGGWYETPDFSSNIITSTSQLVGNATLYAAWSSGIARIGTTDYSTLQDAINAVPTTGVETTILLLDDTQEFLTVDSGKNIRFNLQNFTIRNVSGSPVFENNGIIKMSNGHIVSDAAQGAINVNVGAEFHMSGGTINTTGTKQAVYVYGGDAYISGDAYLKSTSNQRAAVHNAKPDNHPAGTLVITGGTIISTRFSAVVNVGTLRIGNEDGIAYATPVITGYVNGINSTVSFDYYDGIVKGKTAAINNEANVGNHESGLSLDRSTEQIEGVNYKTLQWVKKYTVTFNPNGGTVSETEREVRDGAQVGTLPVPTRNNHLFDGWFTLADGGREVNDTEVITANLEIFAHWTDSSQIVVAKIGNTGYHTLQEAINNAPNNTETTITLVRNTIENVTVAANKNIVFDFQSYKLSNSTASSAITNKGIAKLISGTVTSNSASAAVINNDPNGVLTISGGSVIATGKRQAVYNDKGTVTITGSAYLTSEALVESSNKRGTVQNLASSTMYITGGTIESSAAGGIALTNLGTATLGIKDGNIITSSPILKGVTIGVNNTGTLKFYDGIIKGTTTTVSGTIAEEEDNSTEINADEIIDGITYHTLSLN